ncbi:MAG TPA: hypothetical protein VLM36_13910 [Sphingomicrobium sp.]|nr:hypothetical protein [Sphingomicrobium sp.]
MSDDPAWFRPKRFGFGPGLPISWQGWALMLSYVAIAIGLTLELRHRPSQLIAALILPTIAFLIIGCRTTRGGCRWRFGEEEK